MFLTKFVENKKIRILCSITFSRKSFFVVWDNVEKEGRAGRATDDSIIRRMRVACWIPKATNTYSELVVLIGALLQQWLHEGNSLLRNTYTVLCCYVWDLGTQRGVCATCGRLVQQLLLARCATRAMTYWLYSFKVEWLQYVPLV